ncbi:MAG: DivIVA domain-containing protein, partial [Gemmatimonadota bacterium]
LQQQVSSQSGREKAVQEALVTAQELRSEIRSQAERQADLILQEAQAEVRRQRAEAQAEARNLLRDAERRLEQSKDSLEEMERRRTRFLKSFRQLLEREMDVVEVEESSPPLEDRPIDLDLGGGRTQGSDEEPAPIPETQPMRPIVFPEGDEALTENGEAEEDLTEGYREDVSRLFDGPGDQSAEETEAPSEGREDRDLFTPPEPEMPASEDEDARWG